MAPGGSAGAPRGKLPKGVGGRRASERGRGGGVTLLIGLPTLHVTSPEAKRPLNFFLHFVPDEYISKVAEQMTSPEKPLKRRETVSQDNKVIKQRSEVGQCA